MQSLIPWTGGKSALAGRFSHLLPYDKNAVIYVEPFGGAGSLLIAKPPHPLEVYNDRNNGLVALFSCLADEERFSRFYGRVVLQLHSRAMFDAARERWAQSADVVDRAVAFYLVARQSFSGNAHSWGYFTDPKRSPLHALDDLPRLHERLRRVTVECGDWSRVMDAFDQEQTVWYCDPPYIPETRTGKAYTYELTMTDHRNLVDRLLSIKGRALLSGYAHPIYEPLEAAGWRRLEWSATCSCMGNTRQNKDLQIDRKRVECLWVHPAIVLTEEQVERSKGRLII